MLKRFVKPGLVIPRHQGTTAHVPSLYPWHANEGLGMRGIYVGEDSITGGAWCWDPFQAYADGFVSSPNVMIAGRIGRGKSSAVKTLLYRGVGMLGNGHGGGRWVAIIDPKGEYGPLAEAMDLRQLRLFPGGRTRLNPLDAGPAASQGEELTARRIDIMSALASALVKRSLSPTEEAALAITIRTLTKAEERLGVTPTIDELISLLTAPTDPMVSELGVGDVATFVAATLDLRHGLEALTKGRLAGMFNGEATEEPSWDQNGVVIDVSAVLGDREAFELLMIAVTGWLMGMLAVKEGPDVPRRVQVLEEIWALLGSERVARYFQTSQKMSRDFGVCNITVVHKLSDMRAQADDGTATAKIAEGLSADTETRILFGHPSSEIAEAAKAFGLTEREAQLLPGLGKGQAMWKVGESQSALVQHRRSPQEIAMTNTDNALVT